MKPITLSENLRKFRESRNFNRAEVAKRIDTTRSNITRWEKGTLPSVQYLVRLAELYSVSVDDLIFGKAKESEKTTSQAPKKSKAKKSPRVTHININDKTVKCKNVQLDDLDLEKVFGGKETSIIIKYGT